jgi:hypothetical protein
MGFLNFNAMIKYLFLFFLLPTIAFSQVSYIKKKGCPTKDSMNLRPYFPPAGNQGNSYTCLGWALVYGLMSYDINKESGMLLSKVNLIEKISENYPILSPTYNFGGIADYCNGVQPLSMFKSIAKNGVSLYNPKNDKVEGCSFDTSGKKIKSLKFDDTDFNLFGSKDKENGFKSEELINYFDCFGPFVLDIKNHAMVCVGYDKTKKVFKLINSQNSVEEKNYIEKSFAHLNDIKLIISIKNKEQKCAINDAQVAQVDSANFQFKEEFYYIGNPQNSKDTVKTKIWWLGKPSIGLPWKHKKYYYTRHFDKFCISVLKLRYFGSKAVIGVYDRAKKTLIYTFQIEPDDEVKFVVNSVSYDFKYTKKSFKRGVFFYPEINYTIEKSKNQTNNN